MPSARGLVWAVGGCINLSIKTSVGGSASNGEEEEEEENGGDEAHCSEENRGEAVHDVSVRVSSVLNLTNGMCTCSGGGGANADDGVGCCAVVLVSVGNSCVVQSIVSCACGE